MQYSIVVTLFSVIHTWNSWVVRCSPSVSIRPAPFLHVTLTNVPENGFPQFAETLFKKRGHFYNIGKRLLERPAPPRYEYNDFRSVSEPSVKRTRLRKKKRLSLEFKRERNPLEAQAGFRYGTMVFNRQRTFFPGREFDITSFFEDFPAFGLFNVDTTKFTYGD